MKTENITPTDKQIRLSNQMLASMCHKCGICSFADRKPNSAFGKLMRWHRNWCPGYAAHLKVYGEKQLSR
jgi:hypothetical protein